MRALARTAASTLVWSSVFLAPALVPASAQSSRPTIAVLNFEYGTIQDLLWIAGYLFLAASAWHMAASSPTDASLLAEKEGRHFDGQGTLQTVRKTSPHPDGASGYDAFTVRT